MTGILTASFSARDPLPARLPAVTLLARARVQRDRGEPAILGHLRQIHVDNFLVAPPGAKLHRERNRHRRAHRLEDIADERQVAQQPRAAIALHDLLRRAAEVQIDQVEAEVLHHARGVGQRRGIAAEELRRDGVLVAIERQVLLGLLVLVADDAVGRGELGHHQTAAAQIADEAAEDGIGDPGHGREHGRRANLDAADRDRRRHARARRRDALRRIVEKLVHVTIVNGVGWSSIESFPKLLFSFLT